MYSSIFKYPSAYTESWDSYQAHKSELMDVIHYHIENYPNTLRILRAVSVASNATMIAKRNDSATCLTATRSRPYRLLDRKPTIMMHIMELKTKVETPLA